MAATPPSIRHGVVSSGGACGDSLQRILADLCTRGNPKVTSFYLVVMLLLIFSGFFINHPKPMTLERVLRALHPSE
ncbi:hypothetical protein IEQ34_018430 [Dendrobium chrysotoxum]|uniref:Uncharacterized protein n=1 Tax=Dendrobium chrysotoxum TaxID=161865 RepID=A0AAV7G4K1_DENCH|nr:hypothetical protein IEQ34_018430 [Dendrobium chrysotoxum]